MKKIGIIFLLIICAVGVGYNREQIRKTQHPSITLTSESTQPIVYSEVDLIKKEKLSPDASRIMLLGSFRGLLSSALWWRLNELQQEARFFEIIQLADWLSQIQPKNGSVWAYQAWNLAYNISAEFHDHESKWKWIRHGLGLLLEKGIVNVPNSTVIRTEIGRIYFEKIAAAHGIDSGSRYYMQQFAREMSYAFHDSTIAEIQELADAPKTRIEARNHPLLKNYLDLTEQSQIDLLDESVFRDPLLPEKLAKLSLLQRPEMPTVQRTLDFYHRAQWLRNKWSMDPTKIAFINKEYGPFDWRIGYAHAVYWQAPGDFQQFLKVKSVQCPHVLISMRRSFEDGILVTDPNAQAFITTGDFRIIGKFHDYCENRIDVDPDPQAFLYHEDFLRRAIAILYVNNREKEARALYSHRSPDPGQKVKPSFEDFIIDCLDLIVGAKDLRTRKNAVESALFQSMLYKSLGETDRSQGYDRLAFLVWSRNNKENENIPGRLFPPISEMRKQALNQLKESLQLPADFDPEKSAPLKSVDKDPIYLGADFIDEEIPKPHQSNH